MNVKVIGGLLILIIASFAAASIPGVEELQECTNVTWEEQVPVIGTCTQEQILLDCVDPPENTSCTQQAQNISYPCEQGMQTIQKSRVDCLITGYIVQESVQLNTTGYACSAVDDGKIYVTCDSVHDGNGDGICTSGESCVRFDIVGNSVIKLKRNSQDDWIENDDSYFLPEATVEVLQ